MIRILLCDKVFGLSSCSHWENRERAAIHSLFSLNLSMKITFTSLALFSRALVFQLQISFSHESILSLRLFRINHTCYQMTDCNKINWISITSSQRLYSQGKWKLPINYRTDKKAHKSNLPIVKLICIWWEKLLILSQYHHHWNAINTLNSHNKL